MVDLLAYSIHIYVIREGSLPLIPRHRVSFDLHAYIYTQICSNRKVNFFPGTGY